MSENNKLTTTRPVFQTKKFGMAARLQTAQDEKPKDVSEYPNRIGIVFDDSGSMMGNPIELAHTAVETFIKNCNSNDTALAIYPLNEKPQTLSSDYAQVGMFVTTIPATGGTPLYTILEKMLDAERITRAIAFSDGQPGDAHYRYNSIDEDMDSSKPPGSTYCKYIQAKVPVDTVFIGNDVEGERVMKELAEKTGGTYLHFTKPEDMAKNLKYLAPRYRALLANAELKAKVERGESI